MKKYYGKRIWVQSAGVKSEMDVDGFSVSVCADIGVPLSEHKARSFEEMQEWGDDLSAYDLIIALSPASQRKVLELTRFHHLDVEYWPIMDPTGLGARREDKLEAYKQTRDQIRERMVSRFGPPVEDDVLDVGT